MFVLSLEFPLFLLDLSPSEISFCKKVCSLPGCGSSTGELLSPSRVRKGVWVMLALQQEALYVEELSFPGSDAWSQGEDAGRG